MSESRHCQAPRAGQCLPFSHPLALALPLPWATASQDEHSPSLGHTPSDTAGTEHRQELPGKLEWLWQLHSADPAQQSCLPVGLEVEQLHSRGFYRIAWVSWAQGNSTRLRAVLGTQRENTLQVKPFCWTDTWIAVLRELALLTYGKEAFRGKGLKGHHGNSCFSFSLLIHFVSNILMSHLFKEVFKHVLNAALRNKKLSLLGAQVNCIPKGGNVLHSLWGLKCSQHWEWKLASLPVLRAQLVCPGHSHRTFICAQTLIFTTCFPNQDIITVSQRDFRSVRKAVSRKQSPTWPWKPGGNSQTSKAQLASLISEHCAKAKLNFRVRTTELR